MNVAPVLIIKLYPEQIELNILEVAVDQQIAVVAHQQLATSPLPQWTKRELETNRQAIANFFHQAKTHLDHKELNVTLVVPVIWYQYQVVTLDRGLDCFRSPTAFTPTKITNYLRRHGQIKSINQSLFYMTPLSPPRHKWSGDGYLAYFMPPTHLKLMLDLVDSLRVRINQIIPDLETWAHFFATNHTPIKSYFTLLWSDHVMMISQYERGQVRQTKVVQKGLKLILRQLADQNHLSVEHVRKLLRLSNAHFAGQALAKDVSGGLVRQFLALLAPQFGVMRSWLAGCDTEFKPVLVISPLTQTDWGRSLLHRQLGDRQLLWGDIKLPPRLFFDWVGTWGAFSLYQELVYKYRFFDHQPLGGLLPNASTSWGWRAFRVK